MSLEMMMGMLPPGVQQLYDALPPLDVMQRVAKELREGDKDRVAVAHFLDQLAQVLKSQGIVAESKEQTEPLKLECSECHMTFAVDNPFQYRRRVEEGFLFACANNHEPRVVGTGRLGELTEDEQLTLGNEPNIKVVYPPDYYASDDHTHIGG